MKLLFSFLTFTMLLHACAQQGYPDKFNLGFEKVIKDSAIGWRGVSRNDTSRYKASLDTKIVKDGRYAASISFEGGKPNFTTWSSALTDKYAGDSITLSGFLKTENVTEGFAGLYMRIDPMVAFDNMQNKKINGTKDWTKYSITLPLHADKAERIVFGALLAGNGKLWIDDLKISIDGKDINTLKPIINAPADNDHEFDKGSEVKFDVLNSQEINTLYELGLIWGFLKYYHPNVIKGNYQWDYELFRILPRLLHKSEQAKDVALCNWIESLGKFEMGSNRKLSDSIALQPDLGWITNSSFSPKLQSLLTAVKNAKRDNNFQQYYVNNTPAKNVVFKNEKSYYGTTLDEGFRLLSLYRYWNMIQYFFPYKDVIGEDWKKVLHQFIPKMVDAKEYLDYRLAVMNLVAQIHDTHAWIDEDYFISNYWGRKYLPFKLVFVDNQPVVSECYYTDVDTIDNLQPGDIITAINNKSVEDRVADLAQLLSASSRSTLLRDVPNCLTRTNDVSQKISFIRNGKKQTVTVKTYTQLNKPKIVSLLQDHPYKWVRPSIGYIDNGKLKRSDLPAAFEKFKSAEALIIDLRNYPSDFLVYDLPNYLLTKPTAFTKISTPNSAMPGLFSFSTVLETGQAAKAVFKGKLILLVNETSQSSAEFHAMGYQTYPGCITIGSNTAGADGNISEIILPGFIKTRFSGIGIYYPDGRPTQRIGIVPDIIVKPTIKGIIDKKDEVLEHAINILSK